MSCNGGPVWNKVRGPLEGHCKHFCSPPTSLLNPQERGRILWLADVGTRRLKRGEGQEGFFTFYLHQSDPSCLQVKPPGCEEAVTAFLVKEILKVLKESDNEQ